MSALPSFKNTRALVIDSNKALLDTTVRQLVDLGVTQVLPCRDLALARRALEKLHVDFVLCADELDGTDLSGQALLEALRRDALLSHKTVFVMLASRATYLSVMEAAEAALDSLLLRPFRTAELAERLGSAQRRRRELAPIFEALHLGETDAAVRLCLARHEAGDRYGELCARIAAELQLKAGHLSEALALFKQFDAEQTASWASLGVARCLLAQGDAGAARREVTSLLAREPDQPDALDILGRISVEQGDLPAALAAFNKALAVTPNCILRLQHAGTLAYYLNQPDLALQLLDRARLMNKHSSLFDAMSLMLQALLQADAGDTKGLTLTTAELQGYASRYPHSVRLRRMNQNAMALAALAAGRADQALSTAAAQAAQVDSDDFDLEAANILLALWVRLPPREVAAGLQEKLVRSIARRFCVSRATTAVLLASAARQDAVARLVREGQAEVNEQAELALQLAMAGDAEAALAGLVSAGSRTGNARLIALAGSLLRRHSPQLADGAGLSRQVAALQQRHCRPITHIAGIRRSGRGSGGLVVRGKAVVASAQLTAMAPEDAAEAAPEATTEPITAPAAELAAADLSSP